MKCTNNACRFPFPYNPYPQQIELMNKIYDTLVSGSVGLFESPTGTGKSLSLICSVLYWLQEEEKQVLNQLLYNQKDLGGVDWIEEFGVGLPPQTQIALERYRQLRVKVTNDQFAKSCFGEEPLLDDDDDDDDDDSSLDFCDLKLPQIYYCSRTHSQISQFINEIRHTCYISIRCISLASRAYMCINPTINLSKNDTTISELCLELQRHPNEFVEESPKRRRSKKSENPCPYHCSYRETRYVQHAFGRIRDIEELVELGIQVRGCPYYGSRRAVKAAQVICLPYSLILNKHQRESLGISLEGNIVIFDEAHNIVDAANSTHSSEIRINQLRLVAAIVDNYSHRFRSVLTGQNLYNVQILSNIVNTLIDNVVQLRGQNTLDSNSKSLVMNSNDFLFRLGLDNINFLQLCRYASDNNLVNKFSTSFGTEENSLNENDDRFASQNSLRLFFQFLESLCNRESDGRIFILADPSNDIDIRLQFALINPSIHFREIIDQARSVLFLGGTLQPFSLISSQLFPHLYGDSQSPKSIVEFSCGHIVSSTHVNTAILTHGPSSSPLNFRYSTRESSTIMKDLLSVIYDICRVTPYGVVIFFPSYAYLESVFRFWQQHHLSTFYQLSSLKPIFVDSRGDTADIWSQYSNAAVASPQGACLCSVVGGRLSEGINFSDNLARCVVIVGLPYPDRNDPLLKERLKYCEESCPGSGKHLYDALCMRAVNQSIGRSIRHAHDYASIVLLDIRFSHQKILNLLPAWIRDNVFVTSELFALAQSLQEFAKRLVS